MSVFHFSIYFWTYLHAEVYPSLYIHLIKTNDVIDKNYTFQRKVDISKSVMDFEIAWKR